MASATKQSKPAEVGDVKEVQALIEKVDHLQGEIDKLNEQASEEILKVEQKYNKQRQPLFQQRSELLSRVPHFWITVFINHPQIGSLMNEDDEEILQHLTKLEVQEFDDIKSGYKITLHFEKNAYFKNESIVKEFKMNDAGQTSTKSTPVEWLPGKNIFSKSGAKKDKDGANAKGERKRRHEDEQNASLMRWFLADQLGEDTFGEADELAELIKDEVWPNPLQFYLASDDDDEDETGGLDVEGADVVDDDDDDADADGEEALDEEEVDGEGDDDLEGGDEDGEVHRFSHGTMPIRNLFKNCSYYWAFAALIGYYVNHPLYTAPTCQTQIAVGTGLFLFGQLGTWSIHGLLRDLRPSGASKQRAIPLPKGNPFTWLFKLVSCPNYTYEIIAWIGFTVLTQTVASGLFALAGTYQMTVWALQKHRAYRSEFKDYPKGRKAIFPFVL